MSNKSDTLNDEQLEMVAAGSKDATEKKVMRDLNKFVQDTHKAYTLYSRLNRIH